jgi:hypothetical protein
MNFLIYEEFFSLFFISVVWSASRKVQSVGWMVFDLLDGLFSMCGIGFIC